MKPLPSKTSPHPHVPTPRCTSAAVGAEPHVVPLNELLTPEFVSRHTRFASAEEMIRASGLQMDHASDFDALPNDAWNGFIRSVSRYPSWKAMTRVASGEWMWRRLGYGVDTG